MPDLTVIEEEDEPLPTTDQPTVDAADPQAIRKAQREQRHKTDAVAEFWKRCLADEVGRSAIWKLLMAAEVFKQQFGVGPTGFPQPEASWFQAGRREFALQFYLSLGRIDRAAVFRMHDEHDASFEKPKRRARSRTE